MIEISGASDDLVEVSGSINEEFYTDGEDRWQADLVAPGGTEQMQVHCWYDTSGCWQVGVGQTTEEIQLPTWPISITQAPPLNPDNHTGYSALLSIDAPAGTRLENIRPKQD